jgi:hypothetical protein
MEIPTNISNNIKIGLEYFFDILSVKQREYLLSLLHEERELLLPFVEQNSWAEEKVNLINSIINGIQDQR